MGFIHGRRAPVAAIVATVAMAVFILFGWHARSAPAPEQAVLRATLDNGLSVIIVKNDLAPVVSTSVNYLVGSNDTPTGFPGTAHALEHVMFRGSPGLSADQLANIGSIVGGDFNANTRENLTQYLFTVPAEDLDIALHIEAIRMQDVLIDPADWDKERGAIEQEVAQDLSSPNYILFERLREVLFAGTPYEHDALGTRPSFEATTAAALKDFYNRWYAPNNAILVIVGDVDPAATLNKVKALFGGIARKPIGAHPPIEPKPIAPAAPITVPTDQPNGAVVLALRMPGLDSPDFPALELLSDVLNSERGALYALVPEGKALAAGFSLSPLPKVGMGYASLSFASGTDAQTAEAQLREVVKGILRDGVPAELVEAAKLQEERQTEFQKNSIAGLASIWSEAVAVYGLSSPEEDVERIRKVSVDDVNRVARAYLDLDHAISAVLVPEGGGRPVAASGFGGKESIALGEAQETKLPDWAESALNRLSVPASTINPVVSTLPNGLTLIVQPEAVSDSVTVFGHIKNRPEVTVPQGKEGLSEVTEQLFEYGSETRDRLEYQEALDEIGASASAGVDFSVQMLSRDLEQGLDLLADTELHPAFPDEALEIVRDQVARVVEAQQKSPGYLTQRSLREALFPKGDPSLRDATAESVQSLTRDDVVSFYKRNFRPDLAVIVVIGNVTPDRARSAVERSFGGWAAEGPKPSIDLPPSPDNKPAIVAVPDQSRVQDSVILGQTVGITRSHPDYYALQLGNAVLGGSFYSTRLSIDLRKNAGLVYSVASSANAGRTRGNYFVQFASDPQNVGKASNLIVDELKRMQNEPVTAPELQRVKALMLRQLPLGEASINGIAQGIASRWDLNLPLDEPAQAARRYVALQPADIQAAFKKWIRPGDLVRVSQGPAPQ